MELTVTGRVILGMLGFEPMSGYQIKRFVDRSTRFFWAASYGQIYPELRRLAAARLIVGTDEARGGRRRTIYRLTPAGRRALRRWLAAPTEIHQTRDESLLKVFFSDSAGSRGTVDALEAKRAHHLQVAARLREIEPHAAGAPQGSPLTALRFGIALNDFIAEWCEQEAAELRGTDESTARIGLSEA
jgi:DNA-binding PadR family transcriptional regulator